MILLWCLKGGAEPREHGEVTAEDAASTPTLSAAAGARDEDTSAKPKPQDESAACEVGPSPHQPKMLYLSRDEHGNLKIVSTGGVQQPPSQIDVSLIPPPSDFMDEPGEAKDLPPSAGTFNNKPVDLALRRQRASMKVTQEGEKERPEQSSSSMSTSPLPSPSPEPDEPKTPPVVAPKPKKLPANIFLKSHKAAPAPESFTGHSTPAGSERLLMDPQKVRMEALRKLGLLKSEEVDAGPVLSPTHSPQSRRSWAAPPPPVSPAYHTPPSTPSHTHSPPYVAPQAPGPVSPLVLSKAPAVKSLPLVPAPAAFRDPGGPGNEVPPVKDASVYSPPTDKCAGTSNPEPSGPGHHLSEEGGKELSPACGAPSVVGPAASREADSRRPPPTQQKLPRSQGISVHICPRSENEDERREALKRLGLVRD